MFRRLEWFVPTSWADVIRRTAVRVGFCAVPFLILAYAESLWGEGRLRRSLAFTFCVVLIPAAGLAVDRWRLRETRRLEGRA